MLRCTSSRGRMNPRMVKRRNSPYASHDRTRPKPPRDDFWPALRGPMPLSPRQNFVDFLCTNSIET